MESDRRSKDPACSNTRNRILKRKKYKCNQCDREFRTLYDRALHRKESHTPLSLDDLQGKHESSIRDTVRSSGFLFDSNPTQKESYLCDKKDNTLDSAKSFSQHSVLIVKKRTCTDPEFHGQNENYSKEQQSSSVKKIYVSGFSQAKRGRRKGTSLSKNEKKQYTCKVCRKSYAFPSGLYVHERIHLGLKPYSCKECGKSFSRSDYLAVHNRIHTGTRPYTCNECGKSFIHAHHLLRHERRMHTGKEYRLGKENSKRK